MDAAVDGLCWPTARLAEALRALARAARFPVAGVEPGAPCGTMGDVELELWLEGVAAASGLEVERFGVTYGDHARVVRSAGPALLRAARGDQDRFVAVVGARRRGIAVVAPTGRVHVVPAEMLCAMLQEGLDPRAPQLVQQLLDDSQIARPRRNRVRKALLENHFFAETVGQVWLVRPARSATFLAQARHERLGRKLAGLVAIQLVYYVLFIAGWALIGRGALAGRVAAGWLLGWALLLGAGIPLRMLAAWAQGAFVLGAASLLKRHLLQGVVKLAPEEVSRQGAGHLLGRVLESEVLESLALGGALVALVGALEVTAAFGVLASGAGGRLHAALFAGWLAVVAALGRSVFLARRNWARLRLDLTHDLTERMVGHRTRLAQQAPERWHEGEDDAMVRYYGSSRALDARAARFDALAARGWMVVGLLGLAPGFIRAAPVESLALGVGGMLLGYRGLEALSAAMTQLVGALTAWEQVAPLFLAAGREDRARPSATGAPAPEDSARDRDGRAVIEAREVVYAYPDQRRPTLAGCSLRVEEGDHVLLEGPSGAGKSTFAAVLAGVHRPVAGLMHVDGHDYHTLGGRLWRKRVVLTPQFHDNHVISASLAFNLLLGRRWPPTPHDLDEAEEVCRDLGLGPLVDRMPAGLHQMIGETGWQLSHGERSRLFVARSLLQGGRLVILDESLSALDPETLEVTMKCVVARATALLVIAHP